MRFIERWRRQSRTRRKYTMLGVTALAVVAGGTLLASVAFATAPANGIGDPSAFEAGDGNMTVEGAGALDWNCLTSVGATGSSGSCGSDNGSYFHASDSAAGTANDISWTSGTKLDEACAPLSLSAAPSKDTFTDVSSYNDTVPNGDTFLYGATIRSTANGNASENVELNQGTSGTCSGEPAGVSVLARTPGDKLIAIDYPNTSAAPTINVLTWIATGTCNVKRDKPPCWGPPAAASSSSVTGLANAAAIANTDNGINSNSLVTNQFAEFGIDLVGAGIVPAGQCEAFPQTLWESRSSGGSFTSNPEDIEIEHHTISTCQPAAISVLKQDASGHGLAGAVFQLYSGTGTGGTLQGTCTTADGTGGTTAGGCSFGSVQGSGSSTYTIHEQTAPNGYNVDPAGDQTFTVTFQQTSQSIAKTFTDSPAPGTINIQKRDDAGNPLNGAVFTLYKDTDPLANDSTTAVDSDDTPVTTGGGQNVTCTTAGTGTSAGTCSFTNLALGDYMVVETTTPSGYQTAPPQEATIGLGSSPGTGQTVGLTFTDPVVPGTIVVNKIDGSTNAGLNGSTFTLYRDGSPAGANDSETAVDTDDSPVQSFGSNVTCTPTIPVSGGPATCSFTNVAPGDYFVKETTTPAGYATAGDKEVTITKGTTANVGDTETVNFTDQVVPGTIVVHKVDDSGSGVNGAVFTLYTDAVPAGANDSETAADADDTSLGTCTTAGGGSGTAASCQFNTVAPGDYWVSETTTPSGYATAADQEVTVTKGSTANAGDTETLTFTDKVLHKVIVLVCDQAHNTLDQSDVSFDGGTTTLHSLDTGAGLGGATEAQLCALGGATKSGSVEGDTPTASITVH